MALMFARLARNFVKNGYYPTDEITLARIIDMLRLSPQGNCRMLDPCCGEGTALADLRKSLVDRHALDHDTDNEDQVLAAEAFGVEFDKERAWHAKELLDRVLHADIHDVVVKARSVGLLYLNPPYGFGVSDNANRRAAELDHDKAERLERTFLKKTVPYLAYGGVLVFIVPHYALDDDMRGYLARNFRDLRVYMAPERAFKQCVIVGVRQRAGRATKEVLDLLARAQGSEEGADTLPESWNEERYEIPAIQPDLEFGFHAVRVDAEQLQDELDKYKPSLLWGHMDSHFNQVKGACRPPLRDLTQWHLALALAAGQVTGKLASPGGRIFVIKGDTYKRKERSITTDVNDKGEVSQTTVMLDRFVPVINAIEFTPDHRLGQIVKIA
ncbi:DUF6094 domain-containing protein [Variovorax sp. ZS18.2.2]|uniref:DUF6094 domain-containing protein n=1 Tax=Variovorax sp. ZS18.2.2 TaxID=2971255 RepID=UPI002151098B|nr:DUF6094 domain-containing protein [Variovorax sp. ZS18.2.2]MCR6481046.1 DUF6094 domain-containing protein [Variovorax sp. ZS18.2.2]